MTPKRTQVLIFLLAAVVAMAFAVQTNHVWEDYYITYRSSKNLATGHGLVFNHGERLHTFTSPLGVLLPAVASLLTLNSSDVGALWIFRLMSCVALGGAALLLAGLARERGFGRLAAILIVGWLVLDAKTVDFSINGMEAAFLVLFLSYALWAHLAPVRQPWRHLGAAWAGLMWTRPDGFVYIGLLAAGFWLFNDPARTGVTRRQLLGGFLRAGLLTTLLYLPWFLFAWGYYGTPVPHTITAKSGFGDPRTLTGLLKVTLNLPFTAWTGPGSMAGTFLPAYYIFGGWPAYVIQAAQGLAAACSLLWLLPFLRVETRAASFAFFGAHAYLSYFPYFPFPWYLPATTLLAIFCLGSLLAQAVAAAGQWQSVNPASARPGQVRGFLTMVVGLILAANSWTTWQSVRLFAAQQEFVENGNRRKIGEWLHANARPGDTVFLEPLGYIGFFSGLKTYDFPGLSSREMVAARKKVGVSWSRLIHELHPQWLVLRPYEAEAIHGEATELLTASYELVREFSVTKQLTGLDIFGRPYLDHDTRFAVYERLAQPERRDLPQDTTPFGTSRTALDGVPVIFAHAPSMLNRIIPRSATSGTVQFGFIATAYTDPDHRTDGARFSVEMVTGNTVTVLVSRDLDPVTKPADRGLQTFVFDLPARSARAHLVLRTENGPGAAKDWTCWSEVEFR